MPELWWNLKDAQSVTAGTPLLNFPFSFFFLFLGGRVMSGDYRPAALPLKAPPAVVLP